MTEASLQALEVLRRTDNMQWYVVPLLVFAISFYIIEIKKRNWSAVLLGISMWAAETIWEMMNALVLHFTQYAPLWSTPGKSAYVIYVGLNVEITLFFSIAGILVINALPEDKALKILGIPNRIFVPTCMGLFGVLVEVILNRCHLLIWDWWFWGWPHLYLIVVGYCAPWLFLAWLHDHLSLRSKKIMAVVLPALFVVCHLVFATWLGWV